MELLSQRNPQWANTKIGDSPFYLWAKGGCLTQIAQILSLTPLAVNEKLMAVQGLTENGDVIWEKFSEAFPEWQAAHSIPYDNVAVVSALGEGKKVIVEVSAVPLGMEGTHFVQYIGNGQCLNSFPDPAEQVKTITFPGVLSFVILSAAPVADVTPDVLPTEPLTPENPNFYRGVDVTDIEAVKKAIDTLRDIEEGKYDKKEADFSLGA